MQSTLKRIEEPRFEDDPHDAAIVAPDIVPTAWVDRGPPRPANDATSRERLFAEIRNAHETAVPAVDTTFRASEVEARNDKSAGRTWTKRALTAFMFALVSALAAAAWKHHGDAATQTVTSWMPLSNASTVSESAATTAQADSTPVVAAVEQPDATPPSSQPASTTTSGTPDAEQQIQSMARDLAAMGQQIVELKTSIEQLKANQQAMTAAAPAVRAPASKSPPRTAALPTRPTPPPAPRHIMPAAQAAAAPPPSPAAVPPPAYQPPSQAAVQPNGEPVMRPPAPLPLLPDRQ